MPTQQTFLGASIVDFGCNIGWNQQSSTLSTNLVVDPQNGDSFQEPMVGQPAYFQYDTFKFGGIVQNWRYKESSSGRIYEVNLNDPRELLSNVQLIIGNYAGSIIGIPNLVNCFGYLENTDGFGSADCNDTGMPWNKILQALNRIFAGNNTDYGSKIAFRGYQYYVSLEGMPTPPADYRIGGTTISLLDAINQVCQDCGHDFYVELVNTGGMHIIRLRGVSRVNAGLTNRINEFISSVEGAESKDRGIELRNEKTQSFLFGGQIELLSGVYGDFEDKDINTDRSDATIWPYWGLDENENLIFGTTPSGETNMMPDNHIVTIDSRHFNVQGVGQTYTFEVGEMRAALEGEDAWESYIQARSYYANNNNLQNDPYFGRDVQLGLAGAYFFQYKDEIVSAIMSKIAEGRVKPSHVMDGDKNFAKLVCASIDASGTDVQKNKTRLYGYINNLASQNYGKKYIVKASVKTRRNGTINQIESDWIPSDGGYIEDGDTPLGLPASGESLFSLQDNRLGMFVRFNRGTNYIDVSKLSQDNYIVHNGDVFIKGAVEDKLQFRNKLQLQDPYFVITLDESAVVNEGIAQNYFSLGQKLFGYIDAQSDAAIADNGTPEDQARIAEIAKAVGAKQFLAQIGPKMNYPDAVAVPVRSAHYRYGPWYALGAEGKIEVFEDDSLVPWKYGGHTLMNLVGRAKVSQGVTRMQEGEVGTITVPGSPTMNLGDVLIEGGPNITSINVQVGAGGIKTTYNCQTYSPNFGIMSKMNAERFTKLGEQAQENRRNALIKKYTPRGDSAQFSHRRSSASLVTLVTAPKKVKATTPHEMLVGQLLPAISGGGYSANVVSEPFYEAILDSRADKDEVYQQRAMMSWDGLLRPFTTAHSPAHSGLPHFQNPSGDSTINSQTLNPFKPSHDIEFIARGESFPENGLSVFINDDYQPSGNPEYRGMALRGPMVLTGWGYTTDGKPIPNASGDNSSEFFASGYLRNSQDWPTGPIDLRWDDTRKVWTAVGTPEYPKGYTGCRISINSNTQTSLFNDSNSISEDFRGGRPGSTVSQSQRNKLFLVPHLSNQISLYNGTSWRLYNAIPSSSPYQSHISVSGLDGNTTYHVYCELGKSRDGYEKSNVPILFLVNSTLSSGRVSTDQNGVYTHAYSGFNAHNGDSKKRYLGTVRTDEGGYFRDDFDHRFVYNQFNPVYKTIGMMPSSVFTTTASGLKGLWCNDNYQWSQMIGYHTVEAQAKTTLHAYGFSAANFRILLGSGTLNGTANTAIRNTTRYGDAAYRKVTVSGITSMDASGTHNHVIPTGNMIFNFEEVLTLKDQISLPNPLFAVGSNANDLETSKLNYSTSPIGLSIQLGLTVSSGYIWGYASDDFATSPGGGAFDPQYFATYLIGKVLI